MKRGRASRGNSENKILRFGNFQIFASSLYQIGLYLGVSWNRADFLYGVIDINAVVSALVQKFTSR